MELKLTLEFAPDVYTYQPNLRKIPFVYAIVLVKEKEVFRTGNIQTSSKLFELPSCSLSLQEQVTVTIVIMEKKIDESAVTIGEAAFSPHILLDGYEIKKLSGGKFS